MEGIFDGSAVDGCFYCDLLFPEEHADDCPRCGRHMRYQPAVMMSQPELEGFITQHVHAYAAAADNEQSSRLVVLLEAIHRFMPASLTILEAYKAEHGGPGLEDLRQAWVNQQAE